MKRIDARLAKTTSVSMRNITFSVVSSYEDFFTTFSIYYSSFHLSKKRKIFYHIYFWILGIIAIYFNITDLLYKFTIDDIYRIFFGLIFFVPWIYLKKLCAFLSYYASRICNPVLYSINDKELAYKSGKFFTRKVAWSNFNKFVIRDDMILCVRVSKLFPLFNLITFISKRFVKENDWKELTQYVTYRKEILDTSILPNKFIRWSIRTLFIILIELCIWLGYVDVLVFFKVDTKIAPFVTLLVFLILFIPYYSRLIDFQKCSVKKNLLFPLGAFIMLLIFFSILVVLVP